MDNHWMSCLAREDRLRASGCRLVPGRAAARDRTCRQAPGIRTIRAGWKGPSPPMAATSG